MAAANRDGLSGLNMHGVAFEAALSVVPYLFTDAPDPSLGEYYTPLAIDGYTVDDDRRIAEFIGYPVSQDLGPIINFSFGVAGAISQYDAALVREKLSFTAAALAQAGTDDADKKIVVWAAGNAGYEITDDQDGDPATTDDQTRAVFDSPELWAGLGVVFTELQSHVLAVVALDQDGTIADYSNRCGLAKNFCLAAPGSAIFAPLYTGNTIITLSSAAPPSPRQSSAAPSPCCATSSATPKANTNWATPNWSPACASPPTGKASTPTPISMARA